MLNFFLGVVRGNFLEGKGEIGGGCAVAGERQNPEAGPLFFFKRKAKEGFAKAYLQIIIVFIFVEFVERRFIRLLIVIVVHVLIVVILDLGFDFLFFVLFFPLFDLVRVHLFDDVLVGKFIGTFFQPILGIVLVIKTSLKDFACLDVIDFPKHVFSPSYAEGG